MKITALRFRGWLGLPELSLSVASPLLAVTGPNGAGKTSLIEGIRFALLGELPRGIRNKGDRVKLVSEGTGKTGRVEVEIDGSRSFVRDIATLELAGPLPTEQEAALLPYVLDATTFASLDPVKRRSFLFGLQGLKVSPDKVGAELIEEGVPQQVVDQVLPMLRSGFSAAHDFAKERASEDRGAWKQITGETYGSQKAVDWRAPVEGAEFALSPEELAELETEVEGAQLNALDASSKLAVAKAELARGAKQTQRQHRPVSEIEASVKGAEARVGAARRESETADLTAANHGGVTGPCPCCNEILTLDRGKFIRNPEGAGVAGPDAKERAERARRELIDAEAALTAAQRELVLAKAAAEVAEATGAGVTAEDVDKATAVANLAQQHHTGLLQSLQRAREAATAEDRAGKRTADAAAAHQRVLGWLRAAELLAADGIPARYVAKAVKPINDIAREAATVTGWPQVNVGADMAVTINGTRPYELACESEQWRADAILAAAIARLSGLRLLVLDRFDVLEPESRGALWDWLIGMRDEFDTVIAAGTLKGPPNFSPDDGVQVAWLGSNNNPQD